jgi:hypothetical protein
MGGSSSKPKGSGRKVADMPAAQTRRDEFANFAAPQGPQGPRRQADNMSAAQERQILDMFTQRRAEHGRVLGVTVPVPGTPDHSPPPSPRRSPLSASPDTSPNASPSTSPRRGSGFPPPKN